MQNFAPTIKSRINPYEKKILELRSVIETEAKNLQNIVEGKENAIRETEQARKEKSRIEGVISNLKIDQKEADEALQETISRKTKFIESTKTELKKEKGALKETTNILEETSAKISALMPVVREIETFLGKESNARERFLQAESIFVTSKEKTEKIVRKAQKERIEAEEKIKSLDGIKTYVSDLYGKLASYVRVATETLEYVNETLEKKEVPLQFEIPEGEKVLKIEFNNFNKQDE